MFAGEGGGIPAEGEDISIEAFSLEEVMDMVARGEMQDIKAIVALRPVPGERGKTL